MFVLFALIFFSFFLSALLSPVIYSLLSPLIEHLSFLRLYHRLVEIFLLLFLLFFRKQLGLFHWSDVGFKKPLFKPLFQGIALSLLIIVSSLAAQPSLFGSQGPWRMPGGNDLFKIFIKAASVAIIEELIMRGILLGVISRSAGELWALFCSSALYSFSHFLNAQPSFSSSTRPHLSSGFLLLGKMFQPLLGLEWLSIKGLVLFLLGIILGLVYRKEKNLWRPIGVHGGIVFFAHIQNWIDPERWLNDFKEALLLSFFCTILWIFCTRPYGKRRREPKIFFL
ncbi:CPBP family intramembrane glutamic endopeptidase [Candidatus Methylacidiphilum infernorum]|uniref:CAAX amino terminal protease family n=1 Tax=Methylacidiphilum infernorum (isolate V4) TaxID=481448 RepID=B3DWQ7_METI4|nr:CPBP family intramembrane glutamic endopeptidase [Candidatus Methylacidiphilum infernorum]ACD83720.1 CAAX amino terminal protease family [Methylacidiphilum infernorum V4]